MTRLSGSQGGHTLCRMNTRARMLFAAFLALPALGMAQEQPSAKPASPALAPAAKSTPQSPLKLSLDLKDAGVQDVVRATAATQNAFAGPATEQTGKQRPDLAFRAPRRPHRIVCGVIDCVAYTADGDPLYTIPREQYLGVNGDHPREVSQSCQSGNDLLSTFERYDKCHALGIGLPLDVHGVMVNLPLLSQ